MSKSRVAITAGAVFLSAALAVVFLNGTTPEPSIESEIQNESSRFASLDPIHLEKMSNKSLYELVKDEPFDIYESRFYRDESDMNVVYCQPSLITDEWIPLEIAETIGVKDEGEGFFYETVEFVYLDFKEFCRAFSEYGIKVIAKDKEMDELTGF